MLPVRADNTHHVVEAATRRSLDARRRVQSALQAALDAGEQVTVARLATTAGVSRAYLYSQTDLLGALRELQLANDGRPPGVPTSQRASTTSLIARIDTLTSRNKALREENRQLRRRLEAVHGQLRSNGDNPLPLSASNPPRRAHEGECDSGGVVEV